MTDRRLRDAERAAVVQHLAECADCRQIERELRSVSMALRETPPKRPPLDLTYRLRVIASHERVRLTKGSDWWARARFGFNQILRPLAVPAAGGVLFSLLFFAILTPSFTVHANTHNDVPMGLYTPAAMVSPSPFGYNGQDITVEVTVDQSGAVSDYSVPGGKLSKAEMSDVANFILFTTFNAATAFGQPVSSKLLLSITHTDVRS
jgi:anti-sigma factor RsiW